MILAFGTYDLAKHPRFGVILDGLRDRGVSVVELDEPLRLSTAERVQMLKQPWRLPLLAGRLAGRWLQLIRRSRHLRGDHRPDVVLVGYMGHFDVLLARVLFRRSRIVLDHLLFAGDTARDRGAGGVRAGALNMLDQVALRCADIAVLDTEEHRSMLRHKQRGVVVPVGARAEWFVAGDDRQNALDGPLSVVFFGMFTPLQGTTVVADALEKMLDALPSAQVTMIGAGQDSDEVHQKLAHFSQITWTDWVEPAELPRVVARHDVCLGVFGTGPKARRVVPNKVYQGLAAGCIVVTSDTPPQRRALGDDAFLVPPGDPEALATTLIGLDDQEARAAARDLYKGKADRFAAEQIVGPLVRELAATERRR